MPGFDGTGPGGAGPMTGGGRGSCGLPFKRSPVTGVYGRPVYPNYPGLGLGFGLRRGRGGGHS
ncbi:MAG TPA: DUF5320 family protein, partial [Firmicutes bacterium]|nr:DUF5320 family protein [Bacillota bacterium]